ncbi:MAG: thioesterase [Bacteroidales bacterium]
MDPFFEIEYELRHFEMNKFGEASPSIMLALLEEAAAEHCYAINYGLHDLKRHDIGWVLVSGALHMERYPRYKEKIKIRTWLSSYSTVRGFRENLIFDAAGNIIGKAKGLWMFFDIRRRRPVPIYQEIIDQWSFDSSESIQHNISRKMDPLREAHDPRVFTVRQSDIDMYLHVNNVKYLQWLLDSIPDEVMEHSCMQFIEGRFLSEIQYGDKVVMLSERNTAENTFLHSVMIEDTGRICATAKTIWQPRK